MSQAKFRAASPAAQQNLSSCIVAVAIRQDRDAFQILFAHFAPRVKAYLMQCGAEVPAADDLAQETMLTVWREARSFDPAKASPSTWIFTIARSLRSTEIRHERRPNGLQQFSTNLRQELGAVDDRFEAAEQERRVAEALKALPDDQAKLVRLSFFAGKSHAEIERGLGIPLGTVKSRIRRAMHRLRAALDDET